MAWLAWLPWPGRSWTCSAGKVALPSRGPTDRVTMERSVHGAPPECQPSLHDGPHLLHTLRSPHGHPPPDPSSAQYSCPHLPPSGHTSLTPVLGQDYTYTQIPDHPPATQPPPSNNMSILADLTPQICKAFLPPSDHDQEYYYWVSCKYWYSEKGF